MLMSATLLWDCHNPWVFPVGDSTMLCHTKSWCSIVPRELHSIRKSSAVWYRILCRSTQIGSVLHQIIATIMYARANLRPSQMTELLNFQIATMANHVQLHMVQQSHAACRTVSFDYTWSWAGYASGLVTHIDQRNATLCSVKRYHKPMFKSSEGVSFDDA